MLIDKIIFFDDRDKFHEGETCIMKDALDVISKGVNELHGKHVGVSEDAKIFMYCQRKIGNDIVKGNYTIGENGDDVFEEEDWVANIDDIIAAIDAPTIIYCDFIQNELISEKVVRDDYMANYIYSLIRNKKNIIFICYSTFKTASAQDWIDEKIIEEHECKLMDCVQYLYYRKDEFLSLLQEAIEDEWDFE